MPATRQKIDQGAHSRALLLDATVELLGQKGYSGVSVDAIVRRSGVVRSALYWHFGSKNGLVLAALLQETAFWVEQVQQAATGSVSPLQQLDVLIGYVRGALSSPDNRSIVFSLLLERGRADEGFREAIGEAFDAIRRTLARGFCEALPLVSPERMRVIADAFVDTADGLFLRSMVERDPARLDAALSELRRATLLRLTHEMNRATRKARTGGERTPS